MSTSESPMPVEEVVTDAPHWSEPAVGLTFVPDEAVMALAPAPVPAESRARFAAELDLAFAFVPSFPDGPGALDSLAATGTRVMWAVDGPFGMVAQRRGWTEALRAAAREPEALAADLDDALDQALTAAREGLRDGATALVVADDLAGTSGPLLPPDFVIDEVFPRVARLVDVAREASVSTVWHSDGDIRVFLPAARRVGLAGVHGGGGLDWGAFERLFDAARAERLLVFGGIPTGDLQAGLPHAVAAGTRAGVLAQRSGLLVSDDGGITEASELAAFAAAVRAARGRPT